MIGYEDILKLTAKQVSGVWRVKDALWNTHGISTTWHWEFVYADEVRPGRGHDVRLYGFGDELMVGGTMDVYGNFDFWIAELELVHSSADEECQCIPCLESEEQEDAHE